MNHDTKVGLGLGILLAGIVCAFYFREQPTSLDPLPEIQSVEALDREISESLAVVDEKATSLEKFESRYKSEIKLDEIELDQKLPVIDSQAVKTDLDIAQEDSTEKDSKVKIRNVKPQPIPTFDPEFEFLNEPPALESVASTPDLNAVESPASPEKESESSLDLPARIVVESENNPPKELPEAVEMFSEDLEAPSVVEEEIPLQLDPIDLHSPSVAQPENHSDEKVIDIEPEKNRPQPLPVRDPRVIVPKRVRLNEPIARRTTEETSTPKSNGKVGKPSPSRATKSESSPSTTIQGLPTLDGLEPLDPSR